MFRVCFDSYSLVDVQYNCFYASPTLLVHLNGIASFLDFTNRYTYFSEGIKKIFVKFHGRLFRIILDILQQLFTLINFIFSGSFS